MTTRRTTVALRTRRFPAALPSEHAPPSVQRVTAGSVLGGARGQAVGELGEEHASLQLEGNSRSLGVLTRDRGAEPALTVAQDGTVQVGTAAQPGALDVTGDLTVHGGAALNRLGRWMSQVIRRGRLVRLQISLAPGSNSNVVVVNPGLGNIGVFEVVVPDDTIGQWYGRYTTFDPQLSVHGDTIVLAGANPMIGDATRTNPNGAFSSTVLVLEMHRVNGLG